MSDDTSDMESMLSQYRPAGPDSVLRQRIVDQARVRSRWAFAEAMAAMLLIGMTLAQIGASVTEIIPRPHADEARTQRLASAIVSLDLPIDRDQAYAMAQKLSAGEHLVLLPLIHGDPSANANNGDIGVMP